MNNNYFDDDFDETDVCENCGKKFSLGNLFPVEGAGHACQECADTERYIGITHLLDVTRPETAHFIDGWERFDDE